MYGLVNGTLIGRGTSNTNWITLSAWIHEQVRISRLTALQWSCMRSNKFGD